MRTDMDSRRKSFGISLDRKLGMLMRGLTSEDELLYQVYGFGLPRSYLMPLPILSTKRAKSIKTLAKELNMHPSQVSQAVRELSARNLVIQRKDREDSRRRMVLLTEEGRRWVERLQEIKSDLSRAVDHLTEETGFDLGKAVECWLDHLKGKDIVQRVMEEKKKRTRLMVRIVPYRPSHQTAFRTLNEEWTARCWTMEQSDYECLEHPQRSILDKGGRILVALHQGKPVGVCALLRFSGRVYELARHAVAPAVQGRGVGMRLAKAAVAQAKKLGGERVVLKSNVLLKAALHIYKKLGFVELDKNRSFRSCGDVHMDLTLKTAQGQVKDAFAAGSVRLSGED